MTASEPPALPQSAPRASSTTPRPAPIVTASSERTAQQAPRNASTTHTNAALANRDATEHTSTTTRSPGLNPLSPSFEPGHLWSGLSPTYLEPRAAPQPPPQNERHALPSRPTFRREEPLEFENPRTPPGRNGQPPQYGLSHERTRPSPFALHPPHDITQTELPGGFVSTRAEPSTSNRPYPPSPQPLASPASPTRHSAPNSPTFTTPDTPLPDYRPNSGGFAPSRTNPGHFSPTGGPAPMSVEGYPAYDGVNPYYDQAPRSPQPADDALLTAQGNVARRRRGRAVSDPPPASPPTMAETRSARRQGGLWGVGDYALDPFSDRGRK